MHPRLSEQSEENMFTGLIEELGTVKNIKKRAGSMELTISGKRTIEDLKKGDSVSVNGVCLTVTSNPTPIGVPAVTSFRVDVGAETLRKTNLGELRIGEKVNLERALKMSERLGGHFVTGHIDGVGIIKKKVREGETFLFEIKAPEEIMNYIIPKGSIAVDGISLTVVDFSKDRFSVSIIPYTLEVTTLGFKKVGNKVNLEADIIGKYVSKILLAKGGKSITLDFLKKYGY
jgi:riboflavin synthase